MENKKRKLKSYKVVIFLVFFIFSNFPFLLDAQTILNDLLDQSDYHYKLGEYDKSLELLKKAITKENGTKTFKLEILIRLGLLYWNYGSLDESSKHLNDALQIALDLSRKETIAKIQRLIEINNNYSSGIKSRQQGKLQDSIESFNQAIGLAKSIKSKEHEIKCLRQLSATYYELNDKTTFFKLNNESFKIASSINFKREMEYAAFNLGLYYWSIDNYSNALQYFNQAYEISLILNDKSDQSDSLMSIGIAYRDMGLYDKALEYLLEALEIDRQLKNNFQIIKDLNNIGITYRKKGYLFDNTGDFYLALDYYNQALELEKTIKNPKLEAQILNNIGSLLSYLDKNAEAIEYLEKAYLKAKEIDDHEIMSISLNNLGIVHSNLDNFAESIRYYQQSIDLALKLKKGQTLWEAYLELANSYAKQKKYELAVDNYKRSIIIIEDIRSKIDLEDYKASYLGSDKRLEAYYNLIGLLISMNRLHPRKGYGQESFYYLERAKARALLDSMEVSNVDINHRVNFKLLNREKEILNDISLLYSKLLNPDLPPEQKQTLNGELTQKEDEYVALKREIRAESPAYAGVKFPDILSSREAQKLLPDSHTVLFSYSLGRDTAHAFALTKDRLTVFPIPNIKVLQEKIADYLKVLTDKENSHFQMGYELYSALVAPGIDQNTRNIIILPDDLLNYFPFETLLTSSNESDWLVKKFNVSYAPSASSLRELAQRKRKSSPRKEKNILLAGDPDYGIYEVDSTQESENLLGFYSGESIRLSRLRFSGREMTEISALFNREKTAVFSRQEATEKKLKDLDLAGYRIIHLAAHGLIDDRNPARSSIILALKQDGPEDGFLQMREIFNLRMNADLVVLSACDTGLGPLIRGEGIAGLNRAFFFAGANAVLMSLWTVHDEASSQLMARFYFHLKDGQPISRALRLSKLEMIGSDVLSHPYYWAGFIVTGKTDTVIFPRFSWAWILIGITAVVLAAAVAAALARLFRQPGLILHGHGRIRHDPPQ